MRNVIRIAAILFAIAVVFGCASTKSSTTTATGAE
jgi:ABC-type molybdate transport system substrate-binding protein